MIFLTFSREPVLAFEVLAAAAAFAFVTSQESGDINFRVAPVIRDFCDNPDFSHKPIHVYEIDYSRPQANPPLN